MTCAEQLAENVVVRPSEAFSGRFPSEMPCRVTVRLRDGRVLTREGRDYEGLHTRPFSWVTALEKFNQLSEPYASASLRREISDAVADLENIEINQLMNFLADVKPPAA